MWTFLKGVAQAIGLADFLARWLHDEETEKKGEKIQQNLDLSANVQESIDAAKISDTNSTLTRDQLIDKLRRDGAGLQ